MKRLPRRWWRSVHLTSYVVFALVVVHVLAAGTDAGEPVVQWLALASVALVGFVTLYRVLADRRSTRVDRTSKARELVAELGEAHGAEVQRAPVELLQVEAGTGA
jgi:DMSO/TMAO reductase YedYZ heme-binding membrane subunit